MQGWVFRPPGCVLRRLLVVALRNTLNSSKLEVVLYWSELHENALYMKHIGTKDHWQKDKDSPPTIGVPTLSIVASTASSVALILLLVVLFVLLQPKLKSFHHSRRDQGVSGDQVSIMVDGVQVALPSYEEAVYGSAGNCIPPSDSRVQIVLSEGAGQSGAREMQQQHHQLQDQGAHNSFTGEDEAPGRSGLYEASGSQRSETVLVHQATTSSWVAGVASSRPVHQEAQDSENSDIQSLLSLTSSEEYTDDIPLLKEA
ncbi:sushi domain-containing protein 6 isoform X2 [Alligator sinensis]|uniref:Sushi domain-containing protein 6 isoform X2 n=1 Tax=Alligator sinensis TaxID=38654 RepID=A0A3Q0GPN3_ALLSI|nr:sushi domain-containing protein 6 isoform X2 [Alligator sinensis]